MTIKIPQRIAIIGVPGSGKSTLALQIGQLLNLPVHHLDKAVFTKNGKKRSFQERLEIQRAIINQDQWITEGCSIKTLPLQFSRADIVIYLKFTRLLCIWRTLKRLFTFNQNLANTGCVKLANWTLLKYIWNFKKNKDPQIDEAKKLFPKLTFRTLENPTDVIHFLTLIKTL